jgi:site-specific DNA recombinase
VAACPSKQVPENTLEVSAAEALGLPSFDEMNFLEKIDEVIVHNGNKLIFRFKDGSKKDIYWEDRSRSESWTKEMRAAAGRKTKERYGN